MIDWDTFISLMEIAWPLLLLLLKIGFVIGVIIGFSLRLKLEYERHYWDIKRAMERIVKR